MSLLKPVRGHLRAVSVRAADRVQQLLAPARLGFARAVAPQLARVGVDVRVWLGVAIALAAYLLSRKALFGGLTQVDEGFPQAPSLVLAACARPRLLVRLLAVAAVTLLARRARWTDIDGSGGARLLITGVVALQAWTLVCAPVNAVWAQPLVLDRVLAFVLACLVWRSPGAAPLALAHALLCYATLTVPLDALNWTERRLVLDLQIAFFAFLVAHRLVRARGDAFLFVALGVAAASYVVPAFNKLTLGRYPWSWVANDDIGSLFFASWVNGWLPIDESRAAAIANGLSAWSPLLLGAALVVELFALLFFVRARAAAVGLLLCVAMHAGIFLASGIFFWKWMVADALLALWLRRAGAAAFARWGLPLRIAGTALLLSSSVTLRASELGWWDTPLSQTVVLDAVLPDGSLRALSPEDFAPYEMPVVQQRLTFLSDRKKLVGTFGSTMNDQLLRALEADPDTVLAKRASIAVAPDARRADAFERIVVAMLQQHAQPRGTLEAVRDALSPPRHLHHSGRAARADAPPPYAGEEVASVRVTAGDVLRMPNGARTVNARVLREIAVGPPPVFVASNTLRFDDAHHLVGWLLGLHPAAGARWALPFPSARRAAEGAAALADRGSALAAVGTVAATDDIIVTAFLGDVSLHGPLQRQAQERGYGSLWDPTAALIAQADLAWVNIEGPASCCMDSKGEGHPDPGARFDGVVYTSSTADGLNQPPGLVPALKAWGIDVVATANNHILDRGAFGVLATLDALDTAHLANTGTRRTAADPWFTLQTVRGRTLAWLACTEWSNSKDAAANDHLLNCTTQRDEVLAQLTALRARADVAAVVFLVQGGVEKMLVADERLRPLAEDGAEAGADIVVSYHPHQLQTWEPLQTTRGARVPLVWGRGNFFTPARGLEDRTATIVYVGWTPDGARLTPSRLGHVPVWLDETGRGAGFTRTLVPLSPERNPQAWALALSRFGQTRVLDAALPLLPQLRDPPERAPWPGRAGDLCLTDAECTDALVCAPLPKGHGMCTQACSGACAANARCVAVTGWRTRACLLTCDVSGDCPPGTACDAGSCAPAP